LAPTENFTLTEILIAFSCFFALMTLAFIALFITYKNRIEREQDALNLAEINFERQISEASMKAEQQERAQIAMDLHDEVGALVTVLKINVLNAQNNLGDSQKAQAILIETEELIEKTAESIRGISTRISPPTLVKMGLDITFLELIKTINSSDQIQIIYKSTIQEKRFSMEIELNVYRIFIEILNNIIKHGNTELVEVDFYVTASGLTLNFSYKGIGLTNKEVQNQLRNEKGSGLKSIQSRLNNLKASIDYELNGESLAQIEIKIPIND
jgi:signal transduction histidine kinase